MNEKDQKTRKQWLIMLALSLITTISSSLLHFQFDPSMDKMPQVRYWMIALSLLSALLFSFLFYRCAYKKPGTKFLIFSLILSIASLVISPILYLSGKLSLPTYIPYYGVFSLITQALGVLWVIACWRMLKLNKRLQAAYTETT